MLLLLFFLVLLMAASYGLSWLIDQPGSIVLDWGGYHVETSLLVGAAALLASVAALIVLWAIVGFVIRMPWRVSQRSQERRRDKGYKALSRGIIAVGVGDAAAAKRAAREADKCLNSEPLTRLLKAQAAQLEGDRKSAETAFHEMTLFPETRLLGLRGLHIEARRRNDVEAAHH
ncbi:MAG: heme biosynthesis protein HemY, partial [Methylocystis sp.]|nr:heme biosynthesis protein HemY [Methylocystis sp.]